MRARFYASAALGEGGADRLQLGGRAAHNHIRHRIKERDEVPVTSSAHGAWCDTGRRFNSAGVSYLRTACSMSAALTLATSASSHLLKSTCLPANWLSHAAAAASSLVDVPSTIAAAHARCLGLAGAREMASSTLADGTVCESALGPIELHGPHLGRARSIPARNAGLVAHLAPLATELVAHRLALVARLVGCEPRLYACTLQRCPAPLRARTAGRTP